MDYYIITKYKECKFFDTWITKLEMRAFGWVYRGMETTYYNSAHVNIDWDTGSGTITQDSATHVTFKRLSPYSFNILFAGLELCMSVMSWIRRMLIFILGGLMVLCGIAAVFSGDPTLWWGVVGIAAFTYVPSLILAGLGYLTRVIFRIDQKLSDSLARNGYSRNQDF